MLLRVEQAQFIAFHHHSDLRPRAQFAAAGFDMPGYCSRREVEALGDLLGGQAARNLFKDLLLTGRQGRTDIGEVQGR